MYVIWYGSAVAVIAKVSKMGRSVKNSNFIVIKRGEECKIDANDCNCEVLYEDNYFDTLNVEYSRFFLDMMNKRSYSVPKLANMAGIEPSTLYKLFKNERKWNMEYIIRLCNVFKLTVDIKTMETNVERTVTQTAEEISAAYKSMSCKTRTAGVSRVRQICRIYNISEATLKRYLRVAKLDANLKKCVDAGFVSFVAAVELSYLKPASQQNVCTYISDNMRSIDYPAAHRLRNYDSNKKKPLTIPNIIKIIGM